MLDPQNFSVYAGNGVDVSIDIDPDDGVTLVGSFIEWALYASELGQPVGDPILVKNNGDGGTVVVTDPDAQVLKVPLEEADTEDLEPRNYCHVTYVREPDSSPVTVAHGIMTVLTTNSPVGSTT